jgi:hypothetical protein
MRRVPGAICLLACLASTAYSQNEKLEARRVKNPDVTYAPAEAISKYPLPVVNFERAGLAREGDQQEIMEKIVYPVINKSKKPVAAIVVTFSADEPDITVLVLWHGQDFRGALIERNARGRFDANAYEVLLEEPGS